MKKIIFFGFLLLAFAADSVAQSTEVKKKTRSSKSTIVKRKPAAKNDSATVLSSTGNYDAFGPSVKLRIADPVINRFNFRARGGEAPISGSGIVGMPKGTYGFANGHLLLRNTTATSSGTGYGSGAVGTGTSIQGVGTSEATIGVNGKNPYAGSWLWGDRQPPYSVRADSARRH